MTTRKEFLGGMLASAAAGCAGIPEAAVPRPAQGKFIWGDLLHLGMNMWCDWEYPAPLSSGWEETIIR